VVALMLHAALLVYLYLTGRLDDLKKLTPA
jgi:hypothetical protein